MNWFFVHVEQMWAYRILTLGNSRNRVCNTFVMFGRKISGKTYAIKVLADFMHTIGRRAYSEPQKNRIQIARAESAYLLGPQHIPFLPLDLEGTVIRHDHRCFSEGLRLRGNVHLPAADGIGERRTRFLPAPAGGEGLALVRRKEFPQLIVLFLTSLLPFHWPSCC